MSKKWGESASGPDWTDVFVMMKAIESLHGVLVTVTFTSTVFDGPAGIMAIAAYSQPKDASVMGQPVMAMSGEWPCKEHKDLVACLFAGLYQLDGELSKKMWVQSSMPLA